MTVDPTATNGLRAKSQVMADKPVTIRRERVSVDHLPVLMGGKAAIVCRKRAEECHGGTTLTIALSASKSDGFRVYRGSCWLRS